MIATDIKQTVYFLSTLNIILKFIARVWKDCKFKPDFFDLSDDCGIS